MTRISRFISNWFLILTSPIWILPGLIASLYKEKRGVLLGDDWLF